MIFSLIKVRLNIYELKPDGTGAQYIYFNGKQIAKVEGTKKYFYHTDHLGSTRAITDELGNLIGRFEYQPFGLEENAVTGDDTLTFTGKIQDNPTGLMYFNARYYDSTLGRFITEDLAKDGANWYAFCNNNPLRFIDLNGEQSIEAADALIMINYPEILNAANKFNVPVLAITGAIFVEQYHNVDVKDYLTDNLGAYLGLNTSIGLGQVRVKTADLVEKAGLMPDLGELGTIAMLKEDCSNVMYVAGYLSLLNKQWQAAGGEDLSQNLDMWLTLYNCGYRKPGYKVSKFGKWFNEDKKHIIELLEKAKRFNDEQIIK